MSPGPAASADQPGRPGDPAAAPGGGQVELVVRRTPDGWRVDGTGGHAGDGADGAGSPAGDDYGSPGGEIMPDLVSAMVLAELLAGDVPRPRKPAVAEPLFPVGAAAASAGGAGSTGSAGTGNAGTGAGEASGNDTGSQAGRNGTSASAGTETARLKATIAQLEHALATRVRIEQAIGVLAERHRLAPRQAFDLLRKAARSGGNRVHDLAGEVVASTTNPLLLLPAELARPSAQPPSRGRLRRRPGQGQRT